MRAVLLYVALTMLLAFPLSVHPGSRVTTASPDTNLFMWTLAWDAHAFVHQPFGIFDANIYHPERYTLAYSENLIGSALFAAPVLWVTGNMVLAMNVVALLSCVLCGAGTYLLSRRLGASVAGATIAGLIFAFSPPRFFRIGQLHLTTIQWVPFALAFFHAYLDSGRRRDLLWTIAFFTLQALTSGHGAVFLTVGLAGLSAFHTATAQGHPMAFTKRAKDVGIAGALMLLPVLLMLIPYFIVQREMGLRRSLENWAVSWASFGASPARLHSWVQAAFGWSWNERADAFLFPGYLPVALAAMAFLPRKVNLKADTAEASVDAPALSGGNRTVTFYVLLTLVSIWLSIGPPVSLWPFVYWLPGMNFIRVPSRFMMLALLGFAVLSGIGFDRITARLRARARSVCAATCVLLLTAEFAAPLQTVEYRVDIPAIDRWLDTQPKPFVIAELPLANPRNLGAWERWHTTYMLHSTAHWQKTVEGYSGLRPPRHEALYDELTRFPDERSLDALRSVGVTHVVVHAASYDPAHWQQVETRLGAFQDRLTLEHVEGEGRVYLMKP